MAVPGGKGRIGLLYGLAVVAITLLCVYAAFRGASLLSPGYSWVDRLSAILLLSAEAFLLIHGIGYFLTVFRATKGYRVTKVRFFVPFSEPSVAAVIASFNEELAMLEDTIASVTNLEYANKRVYLLDDSTREHLQKGAEALAEKYGCAYVHRTDRRGYKAGAINDLLKVIGEKYLALFDADQKPVYDFLKETVPLLEEDEKLALVQTPQFYANTEYSPVARGASYQQAVFYEYICEGKSTTNATFCCGTNVVIRTEALRSVGGFDETSVTEDFATSTRLHAQGWKSLYYNKVFAYGLGPETLGGYFTQQMRWAMGTIGVLRKIALSFFRHPRALRLGQWWEYFLSGSYYFIGWVHLILILCPIVYILFGIRPLIAEPLFYLAAFAPYFMVSLYTFYLSMGMRGYRVPELFRGQSLGFLSFWVLIVSSVAAILGRHRAFGVTPKGATGRLPFKYLAPQLALLALSLIAVGTGSYRVVAAADLVVLVSVFWAAYHALLLSSMFYFNRSFRGYPDTHLFRDWAEPQAQA